MHPFGGSPKCPRCDKAVYLAEQVIGPGRRLYHKPCLACTTCNKRLDSLSLLEHDQQPYCKSCHVKNFGTRDLRQANLPHRVNSSPPLSPDKLRNGAPQSSFGTITPPTSPTRVHSFTTGNGYTPRLQPNRSLTTPGVPIRRDTGAEQIASPTSYDEADEERDTVESSLSSSPPYSQQSLAGGLVSNATGLSQIVGDDDAAAAAALDKFANTIARPITQTPTGTRYGAALGGGVVSHSTGSPRKWGGNTPSCPRCGKSVYFAEQVKAVGKTYHKGCLRCSECNTSLDSTKLRDHEGTPFCSRCYNKLHGPQGNGYALLGKAGG